MAIPDQNVSLYGEKPGGAAVEKLLPAPEQPMPRPSRRSGRLLRRRRPPRLRRCNRRLSRPPRCRRRPHRSRRGRGCATQAAGSDPAASAPAGKASAVQVQLASLRSPEAAREDWARLKRENPDLLGKLTAVAVRTDLADKGIYYRVLAGTFGDAAAAERLCSELKRRNHGCVVAR